MEHCKHASWENECLFDEKEPLTNQLMDLIIGKKPTLLERKPRSEQIMYKINNYIDTFIRGFTGLVG